LIGSANCGRSKDVDVLHGDFDSTEISLARKFDGQFFTDLDGRIGHDDRRIGSLEVGVGRTGQSDVSVEKDSEPRLTVPVDIITGIPSQFGFDIPSDLDIAIGMSAVVGSGVHVELIVPGTHVDREVFGDTNGGDFQKISPLSEINLDTFDAVEGGLQDSFQVVGDGTFRSGTDEVDIVICCIPDDRQQTC